MAADAPLPLDDPSVEALDDATRERLAAYWTQRARSELRVGRAFERMIPRLEEVRAVDVVVSLLRRSADDEQRHAALCMRLAGYYAGTQLETVPAIHEVVLPSFGFDDPRLECAALVAAMCCINESIACVWIEACLAIASVPIAVAANRIHLREELDHARLGWAHLASSAVPPAVRRELGPAILPLIEANRPLWQPPHPLQPVEGLAAHGLLSHDEHAQAIERALSQVVVPGFARLGYQLS